MPVPSGDHVDEAVRPVVAGDSLRDDEAVHLVIAGTARAVAANAAVAAPGSGRFWPSRNSARRPG
ncbi:hypothetical protein ACFXG6_07790 [Streptomyces roseus]|uniref:hypothetical protein n=1 Tax=Streptomyces roseus TaxID=66430 RepID=UPI0036C4B134